MPTHESQIRAERLLTLQRLLLSQRGRKWKTSEIASALGISEDTAFRDLQTLSTTGRVPLITPPTGTTSGFNWMVAPASEATLPPLRLNYAQGAALYAAARLLSQQHDVRNDAVRSALIQVVTVLPESLRPHLEVIVRSLDSPPPRGVTSNGFDILARGWLARRLVKLTYEPPHLSPYTCTFAPYLLEPSGIGHTLYFIGHSDPPGHLRTYRLERVRHAELADETFTIPPDFDGLALLQRAWGVMYGEGEPVHLTLRFSLFVSKRVRETRWHPSERVTETAEGLVWEADIGDMTEIRPWIRGWGADCEVLAPAELREELMQETHRLVRLYRLAPASHDPGKPDNTLMDNLFGKE